MYNVKDIDVAPITQFTDMRNDNCIYLREITSFGNTCSVFHTIRELHVSQRKKLPKNVSIWLDRIDLLWFLLDEAL